MAMIDVCNGDADGLFALIQLRLAEPREATLVTGLKHDIALLERVRAGAGDQLTVCDVSIDRNARALSTLLEQGVQVRYFDHHSARLLSPHPRLEAHIDTDPSVCTSLIVDAWLDGRFASWAAAAAWGDNLDASAQRLADRLGLDREQRVALRELGESVNYNAYGRAREDPLIWPGALFAQLARYPDPFDAIGALPILATMRARQLDDLSQAQACPVWSSDARGRLWVLPETPWSARVIGVFANWLANDDPSRAHAVARCLPQAGYDISVRAPLRARRGALALCRRFGGGGREAAAAIEGLPLERFEAFVKAFRDNVWGDSDRAGS